MRVLPDTLRYNPAKPATCLDGRILTDGASSMCFGPLNHGKVPSTVLKPSANP
jgi:hypothetical protein